MARSLPPQARGAAARHDRVTDATWRDALGAQRRVADWELYLRDQLAEQPWQQVLARWWPRLVPGLAANATHGIIRTSHAARSLAASESGERLDELARGLAYWAAGYLELPAARAAEAAWTWTPRSADCRWRPGR